MTDPVGPISAAAGVTNAMVNTAVGAVTMGEKLSPLTNARPFDFVPFAAVAAPEVLNYLAEDDTFVGCQPEGRLNEGFSFVFEYRRYCRVAGIRATRCRVDLEISGAIMRYRSPAGSKRHCFDNAKIDYAASGRTNPFNRFHERSRLVFTATLTEGYPKKLRVGWAADASAWAIAGIGVANPKRKSGKFTLDISGVVVDQDESTRKYFTFQDGVLPLINESMAQHAAPAVQLPPAVPARVRAPTPGPGPLGDEPSGEAGPVRFTPKPPASPKPGTPGRNAGPAVPAAPPRSAPIRIVRDDAGEPENGGHAGTRGFRRRLSGMFRGKS